MPSLPAGLIPAYLRLTRANHTYLNPDAARGRVSERALRPQSFSPPKKIRSDVTITATRRHGWPVYRLTPADSASAGGTRTGSVIYAHGGAWVSEVAAQHWQLAAQIAAECGTTVDLVIYPLIPFGNAETVVPIVAQLAIENTADLGPTVFAGDSAGGQIVLSAAMILRDEAQHTVPLTLMISPAVDLTWSNPLIPSVQPSDPWLAVPGGHVYGGLWAGDLDLLDPRVSPLFGEFAGLGPLSIYTGRRDILNPDAGLLRDKATAAGVDLDYEELEGQVHVYPLLPTRVGAEARGRIIRSIRAALDA